MAAAGEVSQPIEEEEGMDLQEIRADDDPLFANSGEEEEEECYKGLGTEQWKHSLIGYAVDGTANAKLGFMAISEYVSDAWKQFQVPKVHRLKDGVYLFEFATDEAMNSVLERNSTVFDQHPLVLHPWTPHLDIDEFPSPSAIEAVPVCKNGNNCVKETGTANYSNGDELGLPTKKIYSREEMEALRFANIIEHNKLLSDLSTETKHELFDLVPVCKTGNSCVEEMGATGCSKNSGVGHPAKRMYSREEMEALRFVDVAEQKTTWRKMHSALEADVVQEYNSLTKTKRNKNSKLDSDSDSRQHLGRKGKLSSILDHSYHACTEDVGDEDNLATEEAEFSEDDDSEEYDSILKPAFFVEGKPDFDSGPPEDGLEYLRRVRWEAAQIPKVTVAKLEKKKINREQSAYMPQIPEIARCPEHLLPLKQWEDAFLADFTELRQALSDPLDHSTSISSIHQPLLFVKGISVDNSTNLETDVAGSWPSSLSSATNQPSSLSHEDPSSNKIPMDNSSNDYPTLSAILKLTPVARVSMLRKHITLFEAMTTLSRKDCAWLFALCAAVDTPLDADTCACMRSLLRKCSSLRAGKSEIDDEVIMLNILTTISGRYFGQSEN